MTKSYPNGWENRTRTVVITGLLCVLCFALLTVSMAFGQASSSPQTCASAGEYADYNRIDPFSLAIRVITGRVVVEVSDPAKETGPMVNGACLFLFTEKDHKLVASVVANEKGHFMFDAIKPGAYRLVVRDPQNTFHAANGRVQVYPRGQGAVPKHIGLVVRLHPAGTDGFSSISRE